MAGVNREGREDAAGALPRRALTIAGSDSGGGAGLQADLATFHAHRVHGLTAVTAVTVQDSVGVHQVHMMPPDVVRAQITHLAADIGANAVKTGMLGSAEIVEVVADTLYRMGCRPLVVDPVAASKHGDPLADSDTIEALRTRLLPYADLVTPNLGEVELLTGVRVRTRDDLPAAAAAVRALGPRWVLIKGGHLPDTREAVDLLTDGERSWELSAARVDTPHTHGTGCTLSAAVTARLARGEDMLAAVRSGKQYVTAGITHSYPLGAGIGPVGHLWWVPEQLEHNGA